MVDFPANPLEKSGYILEFHDDFASNEIDTTKWIPYYLPHWSSREQGAPQFGFTNEEFSLEISQDQAPWCPEFDGEVRCSSIQTGLFAGSLGSPLGQHRFKPNCRVRQTQPTQRTYTPLYGYFEARIKAVPSTRNLVALWMIGFEEAAHESGEIAIFEVFGSEMTATSAEVRYGIHPWEDTTLTDEFYRDVLPIDASEFHIYAAEWTPTHVDFYVDNIKRRIITQSPTYPMQFMLGIYELSIKEAVSVYPKRFGIDYFRGYQPIGGY